MTTIEFHIQPATAPARWAASIASLCEDITAVGQRAYILGSQDQCDLLDGALWTTRQGSFLSHERFEGQVVEPLPAILLGAAEPPTSHLQILINLDHQVPAFFSRFERLIEFVDGSEPALVASRQRYRFYRDRGYPLVVRK